MEPKNDHDLIEKLIAGYSLRTVMVPDPIIPTNSPEHVEGLDLPHIIIKGTAFWAKSDCRSAMVQDKNFHGVIAFCYTNHGDFFCSYAPLSKVAFLMPRARYKRHQWILKETSRLIWDSESENSTGDVLDAIEAGSKLKIALLDGEDIWNIHPVDLPFYFPETETFELKTAFDTYPIFFRDPVKFRQETEDQNLTQLSGPARPGVPPVHIEGNDFTAAYALRDDHSYSSHYDNLRGTSQKYKRLKVFAELS